MSAAVGRFTRIAIGLHWIIAALMIFNLPLGLIMESVERPLRTELVRLHLSVGITVFGLALARILWRLTHEPPPFPEHYPAWEKNSAHAAHVALYGLMLATPLFGWLILSANLTRPMLYFWTLVVPPFAPVAGLPKGPEKTALHDWFVEAHSVCGWLIIGLVCLHVAAALKHQFVDKEPELQRMGLGKGDPEPHPAPAPGP